MSINTFRESAPDYEDFRTRSCTNRFYRDVTKPIVDFVLVAITAVVVVPIIGFLALLVAADGHNPFYAQLRIGRNGCLFRMWKLRTMVPDADNLLETYLRRNPRARAEWDTLQKLKDDPRITRIGRFLRRTSLDELPQLFNVLKGNMSLVGPRPMMAAQRNLYPGSSYYQLRPGITGLWQVTDRNQCAFRQRAAFDDRYAGTLSLKTDISILMRTVRVVLHGTGC